MNNKKTLYLILTLILSAFIVARTVLSLSYNFMLKSNYPNVPDAYDHDTNVTDGSLNIRKFQYVFSTVSALPSYPHIDLDGISFVMKTPVSLRYYDNIDDSAPAYTIDKGTPIVVKEIDDYSFMPHPKAVGYGLDSLPTNVNGWRLAKTFRTNSDEDNDHLYFIKHKDLMSVSQSWVNENKGLIKLGNHLGFSKRQTIEQLTLQVDQILYDYGIYLSPALYKPIFPMSSVFLLALTMLTTIAWRYYVLKSNQLSTSNHTTSHETGT